MDNSSMREKKGKRTHDMSERERETERERERERERESKCNNKRKGREGGNDNVIFKMLPSASVEWMKEREGERKERKIEKNRRNKKINKRNK